MKFSLFDIEVFLAVAETGSATQAAKKLAMTQPGVSQHIASLENSLNKKLFVRTKNRIQLNDFGRAFLAETRKLRDEITRIENLGKNVVVPTGNLRLGVTDSSTLTIVPLAIKEFRKIYPTVQLRIDVDDSSDIEHGVLKGHYDLGIVTAGLSSHVRLDEEILYVDKIEALVSLDHPLAEKNVISLDELAEHTLLLYPRISRTRRVIDEGFRSKRVVPRETIDVYNNTAAVMLAEAGVGVALLSKAFITSEMLKHKCAHLKIKGDPFTRTICVAKRKDTQLNEAALKFYEILMQTMKNLRRRDIENSSQLLSLTDE